MAACREVGPSGNPTSARHPLPALSEGSGFGTRRSSSDCAGPIDTPSRTVSGPSALVSMDRLLRSGTDRRSCLPQTRRLVSSVRRDRD